MMSKMGMMCPTKASTSTQRAQTSAVQASANASIAPLAASDVPSQKLKSGDTKSTTSKKTAQPPPAKPSKGAATKSPLQRLSPDPAEVAAYVAVSAGLSYYMKWSFVPTLGMIGVSGTFLKHMRDMKRMQ